VRCRWRRVRLVPVIRPLRSRYVTVLLASRLAVPVMRPLASLNVSVCAPADRGSNTATSRASTMMLGMVATVARDGSYRIYPAEGARG
jgi:hypothetical protein